MATVEFPATSAAQIGDIKDWPSNTLPSGWLLCDGSAISRTTFATLFGVVGTLWGAGDGSTTFNLPDCRGRPRVGKGTHADVDALGDTDGITVGTRRLTHKHTVNEAAHGHTVNDVGHFHTTSITYDSPGGSGPTPTRQSSSTLGVTTLNHASDSKTTGITIQAASTGLTVGVQSTTPTDTVPFIVFNTIIKAS